MSRVFVVDKERRPLAPCTPRRARLLLSECKAAVLRRYPFTIILKESYATASPRPLRLKIYPASKTTGLAVINESTAEVIWAAEIKHRSHVLIGSACGEKLTYHLLLSREMFSGTVTARLRGTGPEKQQ